MKKYRVGVIGLGAISSVHLGVLKELKQCEIHTVCDINEEIAKRTATEYGCAYEVDYHKLLANCEIDVVHILTPHYLHTPMAIEAVQAGKHVVLEKPIGISMDQLEELVKVQKASPCFIGVILQNRYNPTSLKAKEYMKEKRLGELKTVKGLVTWSRVDEYYKDSDWRGAKELEGGGLLINQAIHTLDLMQLFAGNLLYVKGMVDNTNHPNIEVEDTAMATLYFENGVVGSFYGTNNNGVNSNVELEWVFENGVLRLLNQDLILQKEGVEEVIISDRYHSGEKGYWGLWHLGCIRDFYLAFEAGRTPEITVEDAFISNQIVLGIYESGRTLKPYKMRKI